MKYASIVINKKYDEIRRVLISYKKKETINNDYRVPVINFKNTRIIDTDDYFKEKHSHTYKFEDDKYTLIDCSNELKAWYPDSMYEPRDYHGPASGQYKPILFRAKDDKEAIKLFKEKR